MQQQITNKQLLKFLPIDDTVRQETLAQIAQFSPDQTLELSKLLWLMFYELLDAEAKYEFEKTLVDIKENNRSLSKNLYKQLKHQIFMRFIRDIQENQEAETTKELREKLKTMMMERLTKRISS